MCVWLWKITRDLFDAHNFPWWRRVTSYLHFSSVSVFKSSCRKFWNLIFLF
jgi:hypothetical protein